MVIYREMLDSENLFSLRTHDIDFLIKHPDHQPSPAINVPAILQNLNFIINQDPIIEFLTPKRRASGPVKIKYLNLTAGGFDYLKFFQNHVILYEYQGIKIPVPHPASFALMKILISKTRKSKEKESRDIIGKRISCFK